MKKLKKKPKNLEKCLQFEENKLFWEINKQKRMLELKGLTYLDDVTLKNLMQKYIVLCI